MKSVHFMFALSLCVSVGYAHKCHQCHSTKSWGDCETKELTCPGEKDHCAKVMIEKSNGQEFTKGCTSKAECKVDEHPSCKSVDSSVTLKCELHCCTGDLCNAAMVPMVSAIMLLVCALVAFMSLFGEP
ncbi:hypothetical protein AWC38_SpisGene13864 [Stylophora pistillata]|uniref:UPAR/Ly6 domain-containing protein n=2 Tax=Stylophora pistillata TaxID=50429 RepID=A0A2B4RXZ5_STYPI|nr:hypothetical protein AWC38_SpisGene13864 [Stylophora pistillata]